MSLEHSAAPEGAAVTGRSYTIAEFCAAERMSRSELYKIWKLGLGPRFYLVGSHRRITERARQDWHREAEARAAAAEVLSP